MGNYLFQKKNRPRRDSNPQSSDSKSDALSIRPRGQYTFCTTKVGITLSFWAIYMLSNPRVLWESIYNKYLIAFRRGRIPYRYLFIYLAGIYGHSAVFDNSTNNILVYGGIIFSNETVHESDFLYAFDVKRSTWNILQSYENMVAIYSLCNFSVTQNHGIKLSLV